MPLFDRALATALSVHREVRAVVPLAVSPSRDAATVRLNVSIGGGGVELLATGPKWYDTRKEQGGGGAIDLTMHLFRLSFVDAVKRLSP